MSTTFSKKSKNLFFSSDVTVFSLHEQHDASLNFWFRTHIILAKIERDSLSVNAYCTVPINSDKIVSFDTRFDSKLYIIYILIK